MNVKYSGDGSNVEIRMGDNHYSGGGQSGDMKSKGAVVYSSQWQGWVPGDCGGWGDLTSARYTVKNLKITGRVVKGPEPRRCGPPGPPTPTPPTPTPPPGQCSTNPGQNNNGVNMESSARSTSSPSQCCDLCKDAQGCVGYTHVTANNECWLKSSLGSLTSDDQVNSGSYTAPAPTPRPTPTPTPAPTPRPTPTDCPGGSLANCIKECPSGAAFAVCVDVCKDRCGSSKACGDDDGDSLSHCVSHCPTDGFADCISCCEDKFPSSMI